MDPWLIQFLRSLDPWVARLVGTIVGVLISMVMVAPRSWRNAIYRALCSVPAGFIFAPAMPRLLWFLQGDDWDMRMAAACAAGFTTWFILEASARFLSSKDTMRRLLEEVVRLQGPGDREK